AVGESAAAAPADRGSQVKAMRVVLYLATGLSAANTVILLFAYLWEASAGLFSDSPYGGLSGYDLPFALSFIVTVLLFWYLYAIRR
ncbi:MAG TPA: hypothetical protein VD978_29980, partial [Azospirillum sp.]|nr:hypothetical protein [Azospirillum sp.]